MIVYTDSLDKITPDHLGGFFVGWPNPPSPAIHLKILENSAAVVLAIDDSIGHAVGFINAISDGFHAAFIPNLEVLPDYQGQGIGTTLVQQMLAKLAHCYAIDLVCDPALQPFYERLGMQRATGMVVRHYARQDGR